MGIGEAEERRFRKRLMGYDPDDVAAFIRELSEEYRQLQDEYDRLKRDARAMEMEIKEHKEREKTIRAVLVSAQKSAEQIKVNAEREAKLVISEAEVKAEGIMREADNRLIKMEHEISELRRNRIQFGARMRSLLDAFRQMLDDDGKDAPRKLEENLEAMELS